MERNVSVTKIPLHLPTLDELAKVLEEGLSANFSDVSVTVVDCPDLTQKPFMLAEQGLCGHPRLADVGSVNYLLPTPQRDKVYNFDVIADQCELSGGFIIGAGAGPAYAVGVNSELMPNLKASGGQNLTHCCKVCPETGTYKLEKISDRGFMVLMNLFISEGKPGKVLEVSARQRTGPDNFMSCIRKTMARRYANSPVGIGGVFVIERGKARLHVMQDFQAEPIDSEQQLNDWLKFFEMSAPLTCLGYIVSSDPGDNDLRLEHFHCFSEHGDGGHYHYDTTPNDVAYRGYFNLGELLYRIDKPDIAPHSFGKD